MSDARGAMQISAAESIHILEAQNAGAALRGQVTTPEFISHAWL